MKKSKFNWGTYLCPTPKAVKNLGLDDSIYAIGFGKTRSGNILLVRQESHTMENYSPDFWQLLPGIEDNPKFH